GGSGPGDREAHPCAALKAASAESPHQNRGSSNIVCEIDGAGFAAAQVATLPGKSDPGTPRNVTPILTLPTHRVPRWRLCLKYSYARIFPIGRHLHESLTSMSRTHAGHAERVRDTKVDADAFPQ